MIPLFVLISAAPPNSVALSSGLEFRDAVCQRHPRIAAARLFCETGNIGSSWKHWARIRVENESSNFHRNATQLEMSQQTGAKQARHIDSSDEDHTGVKDKSLEEEMVIRETKFRDGRYGTCFTCGAAIVIPGLAQLYCEHCGWVNRPIDIETIAPGHHD